MSRFIDSTDWTSAVQWARTRIDLTRFFLLSLSNDNRVELATARILAPGDRQPRSFTSPAQMIQWRLDDSAGHSQ